MSGERADDSATADDGTDADAGVGRRTWQFLASAGRWLADTFRGHSGARDLKHREK